MGQPIITHEFGERLAYSYRNGDEGFWDSVYRKAFPNLLSHMICKGDCLAQRKGIDRVLLLANGRIVRIDEKKRERDYPDILLEYISNDQTRSPGWMEKDLEIDYLAYAFMPSRRCYLFDWLTLQRAWKMNRGKWMGQFEKIPGRNPTYTTYSLAIPTKTLLQAYTETMILAISPNESNGA